MGYATRVFTVLLAHLAFVVAAAGGGGGGGGSILGQLALEKVLHDGREVFGEFVNDHNNNNNNNNNDNDNNDNNDESVDSPSFLPSRPALPHHGQGRHARWMAALPDAIPLARLTIPGTHDAATWNYSQATQDGLSGATRCDGAGPARGPARAYRCQTRSLAAALEAGVRFLDLRFAADPTGARLALWHGPALLSARATLEDVLLGLYAWLDAHPTETVLASLQHERGTRADDGADDAAVVRDALRRALTGPAAARYVVGARGALGTLGEARGKVVVLRRFDLDEHDHDYYDDHDASSSSSLLPGLHLSPTKWPDNAPAGFELVYNETTGARAFVEDYYHPEGPEHATVAANVEAKFAAAADHLRKAAAGDFDSLFITFTSGTHVEAEPPVYPDVMALGTHDVRGVNARLRDLLAGPEMRGRRLGVVVMDFFDEPDGLVDLLLDL